MKKFNPLVSALAWIFLYSKFCGLPNRTEIPLFAVVYPTKQGRTNTSVKYQILLHPYLVCIQLCLDCEYWLSVNIDSSFSMIKKVWTWLRTNWPLPVGRQSIGTGNFKFKIETIPKELERFSPVVIDASRRPPWQKTCNSQLSSWCSPLSTTARSRDSLAPPRGDEGLHHFLLDQQSGYLTSCPSLSTVNSTLLKGQRSDGAWGEDGGLITLLCKYVQGETSRLKNQKIETSWALNQWAGDFSSQTPMLLPLHV